MQKGSFRHFLPEEKGKNLLASVSLLLKTACGPPRARHGRAAPRNWTQSQLHENVWPAFVSVRLEFKACFRDLKRDCGLETWLINVTQQLKRFQSMCCSLADLLSANPAATSKPTETQTSQDVRNQCPEARGGWGSGWGGGAPLRLSEHAGHKPTEGHDGGGQGRAPDPAVVLCVRLLARAPETGKWWARGTQRRPGRQGRGKDREQNRERSGRRAWDEGLLLQTDLPPHRRSYQVTALW